MANKVELLEEAKKLTLEVNDDIPYNDLLSLVSAKKKEIEAKEEAEEVAPFVLLTSDILHDVTRVLDPINKTLSQFKFGRKIKDGIIPTRVPKVYGDSLVRSYPGKYKVVEVPKQYTKNLKKYFAELIEAQDQVDDDVEKARIKAEIEEKQKQLEELEAMGKVKKIVRE